MQNEIYTLLNELGYPIQIRKVSSSYNAATSAATQTLSDTTCTGKLVKYQNKDVDGSLIRKSDRRAIISAKGLSVVPEEKDQIIDGIETDSEVFSIIDVQTITKGTTVVAYICQARK